MKNVTHVQLDFEDNATIISLINSAKGGLFDQHVDDDGDTKVLVPAQLNRGNFKNIQRMSDEFNIFAVAPAVVPGGEQKTGTNIKMGGTVVVADGKAVEVLSTQPIPQQELDELQSKALIDYKSSSISENQADAGQRIAVIFGESDPDKLTIKQLNALARASSILELKIDGATTQDELDELALLKQLNAAKDAIRSAENEAADLIEAAADIAGVDAVKDPDWPA